MYVVRDKVIHDFGNGNTLAKFRLKSLDNRKDKWCIEFYCGGKLISHIRYETEKEMNKKFEELITDNILILSHF
jgi:hypothetical protein